MLKKSNTESQPIIDKAFKRIFNFNEVKEFHHKSRKRVDELISLDYFDYVDALKIIAEGILT